MLHCIRRRIHEMSQINCVSFFFIGNGDLLDGWIPRILVSEDIYA